MLFTQKFRVFCQRIVTGQKAVSSSLVMVVHGLADDRATVTAEMLKQQHPDFVGAGIILVKFDEVTGVYVYYNIK